jgi:hypothetical protein
VPVHTVFHLTDASSGESGQVTIESRLRGTLSYDRGAMGLLYPQGRGPSGYFLPPPDGPAELHLGGHLFRVWFDAPSGVPSPVYGPAEFGPFISVSTAPEPSALALAATAAGLAACRLLRRRKR